MERIGILIISYGSREVAMVDAIMRSGKYNVELFIIDRQNNPFNIRVADKHVVISDLDVEKICDFAEKSEDRIDFGLVGSEKPIIEGVRDLVEKKTKIEMICPTKECAIEGSKVSQRYLFQKIVPEVNPMFKVFNPTSYGGTSDLMDGFRKYISELGGVERCVIKPDKPGFGKGVGVGGEHFFNLQQAYEHFISIYGGKTNENVIVEEKIEGEESSYQGICDGKHLIHLPETRDYKRAFDDDKGPNTGGMGSYKAEHEILPFMIKSDREQELKIENEISSKLIKEYGDGLRGVPFYDAFMHTGKGQKILERNSRPGDPEIINLLPIMKDDFVDVCFKIIEGNLTNIEFEKKSTVVTYIVPDVYPGKDKITRKINLDNTYDLKKAWGDAIKIFPASIELKNDETFALSSRTIAIVGIADSISSARDISLKGVRSVRGERFRNRNDIASDQHIARSIDHMKKLRNRLVS